MSDAEGGANGDDSVTAAANPPALRALRTRGW
jgi:hypothetical protein